MYADIRRCAQPSGLTLSIYRCDHCRDIASPCNIITTYISYSYLPPGTILILRTSGLEEKDLKVNVS